jgi:hypothetical protein
VNVQGEVPAQRTERLDIWIGKREDAHLPYVAEVFLKMAGGMKHLAHRYDRADIKRVVLKQCNTSKGENLVTHEAPACRS